MTGEATSAAPLHQLRGRRTTGQIVDTFDGRNFADLERWLTEQPAEWVTGISVVSVDPHEGYRTAFVNSDLFANVTVVVDRFHNVRLANAAPTSSSSMHEIVPDGTKRRPSAGSPGSRSSTVGPRRPLALAT